MSRSTRSQIVLNNNKTTDDISNNGNDNFSENPSLSDIYKLISKVDNNVSTLSSKFDTLNIRTTKLEKENVNLKKDVTFLQSQLYTAEINIVQIQQKQFERYITISNIPLVKNENLPGVIISAVGLLKIEISKNNISFCKRIGGHTGKYIPLIVVELDSVELKETILEISKNSGPILYDQLNAENPISEQPNSSKNINYIDQYTNVDFEDRLKKIIFGQYITTHTQRLLQEARKLQTQHKIDFIWQDRGTILIKFNKDSKKIHKIKTSEDLRKFITSNQNII